VGFLKKKSWAFEKIRKEGKGRGGKYRKFQHKKNGRSQHLYTYISPSSRLVWEKGDTLRRRETKKGRKTSALEISQLESGFDGFQKRGGGRKATTGRQHEGLTEEDGLPDGRWG